MPFHSSIVTRKGQITIPSDMRRELGIEIGDRVDFERDGDGIRIQKRAGSIVDRIFGIGRPYAQIPPMDPAEEGRLYEEGVAEQNWADLEQQRLDWEREHGRDSTASV